MYGILLNITSLKNTYFFNILGILNAYSQNTHNIALNFEFQDMRLPEQHTNLNWLQILLCVAIFERKSFRDIKIYKI